MVGNHSRDLKECFYSWQGATDSDPMLSGQVVERVEVEENGKWGFLRSVELG